MKNFFIALGAIGFLISFSARADYQPFQIKVKPNSPVASIRVVANGNLKKYAAADLYFNQWKVEVRGQLTLTESTSGLRIKQAKIRYGAVGGALQNYEIRVSGNKRSLTGNQGKKWEEHSIALNDFGHMQPYIDVCNNALQGDLAQGLTLTQALNKKRSINISQTDSPFRAGLSINVSSSPNYLTEEAAAGLPLRVICEPTGYAKPLPTASNSVSAVGGVAESHLTILEQVSPFSGACKITLSGVIKTNLPGTLVQFQYEHTNGRKSDVKSVTTSQAKTAMFSHTYTIDNNPYDDEAGSIRLAGVSHNFQSGWKTYTMRCEDPATNALQTETPPQLSLKVVVKETQLVKGQICPKNVLIQGSVTAGASIEGHAVFIGSGSTAYQSGAMPYDLNIGEKKKFFRVRDVALPGTLGSLQVINDSEPVLQRISITQGMSLMDENDEMIATTGQTSYTFHCSWPQANPDMPGSSTLGMAPDHTGGGGAPTSIKAKSPFSRDSGNGKSVNAGLRSDGELVQGKKPPHQGPRKIVPAGPVPTPYPVLGNRSLGKDNTKKSGLKDARVKSLKENGGLANSRAPHDRFADQQAGHRAHSIPLEKASIAPISSSQLGAGRNRKPTLLNARVGSPCSPMRFPRNAVIKQSGKQRVAECRSGKLVINRTKKVQHPWKPGDPVFSVPATRKGLKKEIRNNDLRDEMPDDLPAG